MLSIQIQLFFDFQLIFSNLQFLNNYLYPPMFVFNVYCGMLCGLLLITSVSQIIKDSDASQDINYTANNQLQQPIQKIIQQKSLSSMSKNSIINTSKVTKKKGKQIIQHTQKNIQLLQKQVNTVLKKMGRPTLLPTQIINKKINKKPTPPVKDKQNKPILIPNKNDNKSSLQKFPSPSQVDTDSSRRDESFSDIITMDFQQNFRQMQLQQIQEMKRFRQQQDRLQQQHNRLFKSIERQMEKMQSNINEQYINNQPSEQQPEQNATQEIDNRPTSNTSNVVKRADKQNQELFNSVINDQMKNITNFNSKIKQQSQTKPIEPKPIQLKIQDKLNITQPPIKTTTVNSTIITPNIQSKNNQTKILESKNKTTESKIELKAVDNKTIEEKIEPKSSKTQSRIIQPNSSRSQVKENKSQPINTKNISQDVNQTKDNTKGQKTETKQNEAQIKSNMEKKDGEINNKNDSQQVLGTKTNATVVGKNDNQANYSSEKIENKIFSPQRVEGKIIYTEPKTETKSVEPNKPITESKKNQSININQTKPVQAQQKFVIKAIRPTKVDNKTTQLKNLTKSSDVKTATVDLLLNPSIISSKDNDTKTINYNYTNYTTSLNTTNATNISYTNSNTTRMINTTNAAIMFPQIDTKNTSVITELKTPQINNITNSSLQMIQLQGLLAKNKKNSLETPNKFLTFQQPLKVNKFIKTPQYTPPPQISKYTEKNQQPSLQNSVRQLIKVHKQQPSQQNLLKNAGYNTISAVQCIAKNGRYERAGKDAQYRCIRNYKDALRVCYSSTQCEGDCIIRNYNSSWAVCQLNDSPFGCWAAIEDFTISSKIVCRQ